MKKKSKNIVAKNKANAGISIQERKLFLKFVDADPAEQNEKDAEDLQEQRQEIGLGTKSESESQSDAQIFLRYVADGQIPAEVYASASPKLIKKDRSLQKAQGKGEIFPDAILDLHGFRAEAARAQLLGFVESGFERGRKCLLIIHGKGSGVLKELVWQTLEHYDKVLMFFAPPPSLGGDGAIIVKLL